ncbi:hypothetical protein LPB140_08865 [Sphingorhabdus lutea]|uniref:Uncharacterized protein n=1 Tax=Sphingorhabdus lutea TaxID=1913578 RepID=A0A1L3JCL6_9SPHN|nr:hypothetical protein LPB140_08865 [Sphingorhabdus lutea]
MRRIDEQFITDVRMFAIFIMTFSLGPILMTPLISENAQFITVSIFHIILFLLVRYEILARNLPNYFVLFAFFLIIIWIDYYAIWIDYFAVADYFPELNNIGKFISTNFSFFTGNSFKFILLMTFILSIDEKKQFD